MTIHHHLSPQLSATGWLVAGRRASGRRGAERRDCERARSAQRTADRRRRRRRGTMLEPNSLDLARDAFGLLVSGPAPLAVDGARFAGLPDRRLPLSQLRTLLLARSCPQATRDQVWAHLVTRARTEGGAWTIGCVGVALPALTSIAAQLTDRFTGDPADIAAEVLTGFLTALTRVDIARPRIMLRLRWAAYRAGHAALTEALDAPRPTASSFGSAVPLPPWGHPDLVLARAVTEQVITALEADVIGATRLEDVAVADWAAAHGRSTWAVYKLRKRAEQRLVTHLLDFEDPTVEASDAAPANPARPAGTSRQGGRPLSKTDPRGGLQLRRQLPAAARTPEDPRCA